MNEITLPNYTNYVVKKGDTLYSISKANNVSVDTIIKDNALSNNNLSIGKVLKLRLPSTEFYVEDECFGIEDNPVSIKYTVKKGDSLYSIAKKYNVTVDEIKRKNNLKSNILSIGQILTI